MKFINTLIFLCSLSCLQAQIAISEILYEEPSWDTGLQYIELWNFSEDTINIMGWSLQGDINLATLPDLDLVPDERLVITSDILALLEIGVILDMAEWGSQQIFGDPFFLLFNPEGEEVVRIEFDESLNWPVAPSGVAIELCDPYLSANTWINWSLAQNSITSGSNELLGTPGEENSCTEIEVSTSNLGEIESIQVYPNPCTSILKIDSDLSFESLTVYNLTGARVLQTFNTNMIDVSDLKEGFYILSILDENESFVKQFEKY